MQQKKIYHKYIISVGSNSENDRAVQNIQTVFNLLTQRFEAVVFSAVIPTRAVDVSVDCRFFNAVASFQSLMSPVQLKSFLKEAEKEMGRKSSTEEVAIDMDIILVDGQIVHQDYENRAFIRALIRTIEVGEV